MLVDAIDIDAENTESVAHHLFPGRLSFDRLESKYTPPTVKTDKPDNPDLTNDLQLCCADEVAGEEQPAPPVPSVASRHPPHESKRSTLSALKDSAVNACTTLLMPPPPAFSFGKMAPETEQPAGEPRKTKKPTAATKPTAKPTKPTAKPTKPTAAKPTKPTKPTAAKPTKPTKERLSEQSDDSSDDDSSDEDREPSDEDRESSNEESSDEEYQVEEVLKHRARGSKHEYLLKWQGYGAESNTWEPASNVCPILLKEFENRRRPAPAAPPAPAANSESDSEDDVPLSKRSLTAAPTAPAAPAAPALPTTPAPTADAPAVTSSDPNARDPRRVLCADCRYWVLREFTFSNGNDYCLNDVECRSRATPVARKRNAPARHDM